MKRLFSFILIALLVTACASQEAFKQARTFFYFAAFKNHIGIYPPVVDDKVLIEATAQYRSPKGSLTFRNNNELPLAIIGEVAVALASQYAIKQA